MISRLKTCFADICVFHLMEDGLEVVTRVVHVHDTIAGIKTGVSALE